MRRWNQQRVARPAAQVVPEQSRIMKVLGKKPHLIVQMNGEIFVLHHPIGHTALKADCWIMSTEAEIYQLMSNSEHPGAKKVISHRLRFKSDLAVKEGLLRRAGETKYFLKSSDVSREDAERVAEKEASRMHQQDLVKWNKTAGDDRREKRPTKPDFRNSLEPQVAQDIRRLQDYFKLEDVKRAAEAAFPYPDFETKSGISANVSQVVCTPLQGVEPSQLEAYVSRYIVHAIRGVEQPAAAQNVGAYAAPEIQIALPEGKDDGGE